DAELDAQEDEVRAAAHSLASKRGGLERMQGSLDASDAAARVAEQLAAIRSLGERYVQLKLAAAVLKQEVARYRDKHKDPILRGASDLFARLTLGAFTGLEADYDAADEPVLVCVRAGGERVSVRGLSQGTHNQLYLALRLASVRELAAHQELMP